MAGAASTQDAPGFPDAVTLCRDAMLARVQLADLPSAQGIIVPASPEVRSAHPLGSAPRVWVLVGRSDANVTLVEPEPKLCNVYAQNVDVDSAFDAGASALTSAGFTEGETEQRRSGGIERNFRSADRNVRVELQTFGEAPDVLTMALFGRRR
jgi:hypothetical protein